MRRFLAIVGATALLALIMAVVVFGFAFTRGHQVAIEGVAFIDEAVPAITKDWSPEELFQRASPEFHKLVTPEALDVLFQGVHAQLGTLVEYEGATAGDTNYNFNLFSPGSEGAFTGSYSAKARYRHGAATFRIAVVKRDGRWMINNFHVDPSPGPRVEEHI
jgi:hypothetical protein